MWTLQELVDLERAQRARTDAALAELAAAVAVDPRLSERRHQAVRHLARLRGLLEAEAPGSRVTLRRLIRLAVYRRYGDVWAGALARLLYP